MSGEQMKEEQEHDGDVQPNELYEDFSFDQTQVRLSGHTRGDGFLRLNFTLPMPLGNKTRVVVRMFAEKMGLKNVNVTHLEAIDRANTYCVVEAQTDIAIDATAIVPDTAVEKLTDLRSVCRFVEERLQRKIIVAGACLGVESDSVVMDTIFTLAGYMGEPGLEAYPCFQAKNLRAEYDMEALVRKLLEVQADAILICKVVAKGGEDPVVDLRKFIRMLDDAETLPDHLVKICVNPRMTIQVAEDMGYDAGFGAGTLPLQVADFIAQTVVERI